MPDGYNELLTARLRRDAPSVLDGEVRNIARAIQLELEEVWGRGMTALVIKQLLIDVIELAIMEQRETES